MDEFFYRIKEWDFRIIRRIFDFDVRGMFEEIREMNYIMCGFGGVGIVIVYFCFVGVVEVEFFYYIMSFEVSCLIEVVVGYVSIVFRC